MNLEENKLICEVLASDLAKIIADGLTAASRPSDFPKYMGTCLLKTSKDRLTAVSTDCKRLAVASTPCEIIESSEEMVLLASTVKEFGKTLASNYANETVKILTDDSTVWFQVNGVEFSIEKLDVAFPKYGRILNDEVHTLLRVNAPELIAVLERIAIVAQTNLAHAMMMFLTPENNEVTITARLRDYAFIRENFSAEIEQNDLIVGFNLNYFLDGLKAIGKNTVVIEFGGSQEPARMRRENDDSFLYLLMPLRLMPEDKVIEDD